MKNLSCKMLSSLSHEMYIIRKLSSTYIFDAIVLLIMTSLASCFYNDKSWSDFPSLIWSIIYSFLYIIVFATANQLNSIEEDKLNKPYRLLPSGQLSQRQVYNRMIVYSVIYLVVSLYLGLFLLSICWLALIYLHEHINFHRHWFTKNHVIMPLGAMVLHVSGWSVVAPLTPKIWVFFILLCAWCSLLMNLQDFRDQEGDRSVGRKTLPLAYGDSKARFYQGLVLVFISPLLYGSIIISQTGISEAFNNITVIIILIIQVFLNWYIAFRLLRYRSAAQDNITYHCWVIFYLFTVPLIPIIYIQ